MIPFPNLRTLRPEELGLILGVLAVAFTTAYVLIARPIYNVFFHPLKKYPGPKLWAATRLPYAFAFASGRSSYILLALHSRYGDIVRVAPDELSFVRPDAWKEIMGHRKSGQHENGKDPIFYASSQRSIVGSPKEEHSHARRILSHGFSAKRMLEQQPLIRKYVDLLFRRLREKSANGTQALDITSWYNYTTFDIIGDLAFGEPFDCLESSTMHPWVELIFNNVKQSGLLTACRYIFHNIDQVVAALFPSAVAARTQHQSLVKAKVAKRLNMVMERPDFMDSMARKDKGNLTLEQIEENSDVLIIAGSETTATVLSFVTYLLCKDSRVMAKVTDEVRSKFKSEDEIDMTHVQSLKYMLAVLDESMRMFPAVPAVLPRRTPPQGQILELGKTVLSIYQWTMYHHAGNFARPDDFVPERWLEGADPVFCNDKKAAFNPFSYGSRDCIGKNLAYSEMRMILARMLFNFEITLDERCRNWAVDMPIYTLWEKPPILAYSEMRLIMACIVWNFDFALAPDMEDWYDRCMMYGVWDTRGS
ncbi:hypothetical protein PG989_001039 [Apiospora arundinis]